MIARVEVIVPARNPEPRALRWCLEGCAGIAPATLVDDASEPAIEVGDLAPSVRVVRSPCALGVSGARNLGLDRARREFVLFVDADDRPIRAGVRAMLDLADATGAVGVVAARFERGEGGVAGRLRPVPPEWAGGVLASWGDVFRPIALFGGSGLLVRREALAREGEAPLRFDPALHIGEDRDFLARLARRGPIGVCAEPALTVTIHSLRPDASERESNLTSDAHLERRIADHLELLRRHLGPESEGSLREATRWLIGRAAKAGVSREAWRGLAEAAAGARWRIPVKARLRRWRR